MSDSARTESSAASARARPAVGGIRRAGQVALPPLLMLYLGLGVVQIFLAGLGVFSLDGEQLGGTDETAFGPHRFVALLMTVVALLVVAAAIARPGRQVVIMAVSLLLLVAVVQGVLASAGEDTALFGGLHALFGIGSLGLAGRMLSISRPAQQSAAAEASSSA
jgi:hypothetical protein